MGGSYGGFMTIRVLGVDYRFRSAVPERGPLIVVANHINFLEAPIVYTHLRPRPVVGFAKAENWQNPLLRPLAELWDTIPVHRGEADVTAIRRALAVLRDGGILGVTPEGTRTGDGRMRRGRPGVALLALRSGAPIQPMACHGHEAFWTNVRRLRRTDFVMTVGSPFRLIAPEGRSTSDVRQRMVDEVMYQLSALLPVRYRGDYHDLAEATEEYLRFAPGAESNLRAALV
jgi:1-acyl-sn-glycerol-3-phosphate acyltransferase